MIELDVDMNYLIEEGELDCVVLNDENGEHEPMEFRPSGGECELTLDGTDGNFGCSECLENIPPLANFCPNCGKRIRKAVKR